MNPALLWQEDAPLLELVKHAALRYRDKFGLGWPNTAKVHPSALDNGDQETVRASVHGCTIRVIPCTYTQPGQVLIGHLEERP